VVGQGDEHAAQHPSIICTESNSIQGMVMVMGMNAYLGEHFPFTTDIAISQ
jgi:hypothetical protein